MKKDREFYDAESSAYSARRYPSVAKTFTQFFFKERLSLVLNETKRILDGKSGASVLEIGCADGVVLRTVYARSAEHIGSAVGIDQSAGMIEAANALNEDPQLTFEIRDSNASLPSSQDIIIEIGVLNYLDIDAELVAVQSVLEPDGRYLCSLSGKSSSLNFFHPYGDTFEHLRTYSEYEQLLKQYFHIEKSMPVGLFIPLLWKLPLAASIQGHMDRLFTKILPNLYLEKVYIVRRR